MTFHTFQYFKKNNLHDSKGHENYKIIKANSNL